MGEGGGRDGDLLVTFRDQEKRDEGRGGSEGGERREEGGGLFAFSVLLLLFFCFCFCYRFCCLVFFC